MKNIINLEIMAKDGEEIMKQLAKGNMVVVRSKNDFLYILDFEDEFHLFSHSPTSVSGGQKRFPKDEKHIAVIRNLAKLVDSLFIVEYDKEFTLYGVMSSAETGILTMFPGGDRDADEEIEFMVPNQEKQKDNRDNIDE